MQLGPLSSPWPRLGDARTAGRLHPPSRLRATPEQLRPPQGRRLREDEKDSHGNILADYTVWTSANDLKAKRFYFRTYQNSQIRMVDLAKMNHDAKDVTKVSMQGDEVIKSLTP